MAQLTEDQAAALTSMQLAVPEGGFFDECFTPRVGLGVSLASLAVAVGASVQSIALVLVPDPSTLTKWAAGASAAAILASFASLGLSYQALIDCEQQQQQTAERDREIRRLQEQQRTLQRTLEALQREVERLKQE